MRPPIRRPPVSCTVFPARFDLPVSLLQPLPAPAPAPPFSGDSSMRIRPTTVATRDPDRRGPARSWPLVLGADSPGPASPTRRRTGTSTTSGPGMKGTGQTVMVGTKLEEFGAEVLGVMKGRQPRPRHGPLPADRVQPRARRDHPGDERQPDLHRRQAARARWPSPGSSPRTRSPGSRRSSRWSSTSGRATGGSPPRRRTIGNHAGAARLGRAGSARSTAWPATTPARPRPDGRLGRRPGRDAADRDARWRPPGSRPGPWPCSSERFRPLGLAPMAGRRGVGAGRQGGGGQAARPGRPAEHRAWSRATSTSRASAPSPTSRGTGSTASATRCSASGACEFPMMTGYIHTVYPRASVSMKMGSPLKVVGVLDTDVSTGVAGRIGPKPDMLPVTRPGQDRPLLRARTRTTSRSSASRTCCPTLVMAVLTNAIDTEGNLPDELTARIKATIQLKGHDPIELDDTLSGPRYTGPDGPGGDVQPDRLDRQHPGPEPAGPGPDRVDRLRRRDLPRPDGRRDRVGPARLRPARAGRRRSRRSSPSSRSRGTARRSTIALPLPADFPEGTLRGDLCDSANSLRRRFRNEPAAARAARPRRAALGRSGSRPTRSRTALYLHVPLPDRGLAVQGQALPEPARERPRRLRRRAGRRRSRRSGPTSSRRPRRPGSSRGRSRSGSPWSRTPGLSLK